MLLTALCNALLVVSLFPTHVLGNDGDEDDSVTFEFTDCAFACIDATGFSTGSEDEQKSLCVASRDGLLEAIEACMLSTCSDGLDYVDQDLLTPMQTGCKELEKPVSDQDIDEAEAAAVVLLATASIYIQATSTSAQPTVEAESSSQVAPTSIAQSTLSTEATTIILISTATGPASLAQGPEPTTAAVVPSGLATTAVEQSSSSVESTTEDAIPIQSTSTTTSSIMQSSSISSMISESTTSLVQTTVQPSVSQDANGQYEASSTPATPAAVTSTTSAEGVNTKSTTSSTPSSQHAASTTTSTSSPSGGHTSAASSITASSTGDDSLEMETATPTAYTGTLFTLVTSITPNTGSPYLSATSSSSSSSSTSESGIGGGSPFSTSVAASKQHTYGLATLFAVIATLSVVM